MSKEKTFVYNDEKQLGQLYILSKIKSGSEEDQSYLANLVASTIRREYYEYPDRQPLLAFKASLQKANLILERFNKKVMFICAVLCQGRLYLAQTKDNYFTRINKAKFETLQENIKPIAKTEQVPLLQPETKRLLSILTYLKKLKIDNFQRALLGSYLLFILIFSSAVYFSHHQAKKQQLIAQQNIFNQAKQKYLQAEAVLMFNQNERARTLLKESQDLLASLPDSANKTALKQNIEAQLNKSNKLLEIKNLASIILDEAINGLVGIGKDIYGFNSDSNALFKISDSVKPVSRTSINLGYLQKAAVLEPEDIIIFLTDTPGLAAYSNNKLIELRANLPPVLIKDIASYSQYIYFLTENQIYRYYRTLAGFSGPYSWLKQEMKFSQPVSLAIDGNIYVLDNDQVLKFFRGHRQDFSLNFKLTQPIKIFTLANLNYLYILEKNRVLVFDKKGQLIAQVINSQFNDLKDIWVNKDKMIYLLNKQEILKFEIEF